MEQRTSKQCSTCGIVKPLDDFSFDKRRKDGRQARCRQCERAYQKRYRQEQRERYLARRRAEAVRRREKIRAYHLANRDRIREKDKEWRASLTGEALESHRAKRRATAARYRDKNPDACNERIRAWKQANPDKTSESGNRRRAWKHGNGTPEKFTRTEIGERDGWTCGICELPIDKTLRFPDQQSASLDHIIPLSLGGEHSRANSRIAHWICNVRRGADRRHGESEAAA